uniref:Uncharacterized protein n=1 Tax=Avena sativa TaxID=4498 RepID=A0ACD5TGK3_AVESA
MAATASDKQQEVAQPASDGASTASVPEAVCRGPLSDLAVAGAAEESGGGVGEDEQVERFYALLANIRALRDVYGPAGPSRKRARVTEPPWRPKFRMEDFREADGAACAKKERRDCAEQQRRRPENDDDDDAEHEGEVVEEDGRVSASQSTHASSDSS